MPTQRFTLTEWLPDQPTTANTLQEATNVVPATIGYIPFPTAVDVSNAASNTLNNIFAAKYGNINYIFAGSNGYLYQLDSTTLNLNDVSKTNTTTYTGTDQWKFIQFGDAVLAANNDTSTPIQYFNLSGGSHFEDLGTYASGSTYIRSGTTVTVTTTATHGLSVGQTVKIAFTSGTATNGEFTITNSDKTISNVAVTSNVVTITTSAAHNYSTGNTVNIAATTNTAVNGTYVITGTPTTTTFTYAKTTSNITSVADTGTVINYNTFTFTHGTSGTTSGNVNVYTSSAPSATYLTVVRDFVVAAGVGGVSNKVQWSDLNNEGNWSSGAASQSDFQIISDGGDIHGITGGEFGIILLEKAIVRMSYIGSPFFFQFDVISRGLGCLEGNSVTQYGGITYFLASDGFYSCDGHMVTPIGLDKIDRTFFSNADISDIDSMSAAVDPVRKIIVWNYANIFGGRSLLVYNFLVKKWSICDTDVDYLASIASTGTTLEGIDSNYKVTAGSFVVGKKYTITSTGSTNFVSIGAAESSVGVLFTATGVGTGTGTAVDMAASIAANRAMSNTDGTENLPISLDDRYWSGGKFLFAGARGTKIVSFTGSNADANIVIGDIEQGYNSVINLVRAQVQDGSYDISVSSRRLLQDDANFGSTVSASSEGRCSFRSAGRYHRISITPTGAWSNIISIDADFVPQGER